jgi:hypothetical protein
MDPNDLHHIFGNPNHNLDTLVRQYEGSEAAGRALVEAVDVAFNTGALIVDADGLYKQVFNVGGSAVIISGRVVNMRVRIGTAWIPCE